jgi:coenzyme F420-reducing hydrogenase beta subunit
MTVPKNISNVADCYGCGVCAIACPHKIIQISQNEEGFYQPNITNLPACTQCGLCVSACAYLSKELAVDEAPNVTGYAGWSMDSSVRKSCSSGGIGFEVGRYLLGLGYSACGVRYNVQQSRAEHFLTTDDGAFRESMGSKYIQSYTVDAFSQFKKGQKYFVTGTPCQIDSLRRWIKQRGFEDDFVLMDFFCHGVPSMIMWTRYLELVEQTVGQVKSVAWRNKRDGWHDSWAMTAAPADGGGEEWFSSFSKGDLFYRVFLGDGCLGRACYRHCKYKGVNSSADIRIGDLWGAKYRDDEQGVNGVLALTDVGRDVVDKLGLTCEISPESLENIMAGQMKHRLRYPVLRNRIIACFKKRDPWASLGPVLLAHKWVRRIQNVDLLVMRRLSQIFLRR